MKSTSYPKIVFSCFPSPISRLLCNVVDFIGVIFWFILNLSVFIGSLIINCIMREVGCLDMKIGINSICPETAFSVISVYAHSTYQRLKNHQFYWWILKRLFHTVMISQYIAQSTWDIMCHEFFIWLFFISSLFKPFLKPLIYMWTVWLAWMGYVLSSITTKEPAQKGSMNYKISSLKSHGDYKSSNKRKRREIRLLKRKGLPQMDNMTQRTHKRLQNPPTFLEHRPRKFHKRNWKYGFCKKKMILSNYMHDLPWTGYLKKLGCEPILVSHRFQRLGALAIITFLTLCNNSCQVMAERRNMLNEFLNDPRLIPPGKRGPIHYNFHIDL